MIAGDRIKEARLKRGLSQEQLGDLLGVTKVSVCGYETGTRTPTLDTFIKLIDILDINPNQLLNRGIGLVSEKDENYNFKISKEELNIIKAIRKDKKLYKEIISKIKM